MKIPKFMEFIFKLYLRNGQVWLSSYFRLQKDKYFVFWWAQSCRPFFFVEGVEISFFDKLMAVLAMVSTINLTGYGYG